MLLKLFMHLSMFCAAQELKTILDYGRKLSKYANDEDLIPGLGMPTLHGGPWDVENKKRDVREVFRVYVEEGVAREGAFTPQVGGRIREGGGREGGEGVLWMKGSQGSFTVYVEGGGWLGRELLHLR